MLALNSKPMGFILSFHVILYTVHFTKFFLKRSNKIHTQVIILKFSHSPYSEMFSMMATTFIREFKLLAKTNLLDVLVLLCINTCT